MIKTEEQLQQENEVLRKICAFLHWTSRRYCDNRQTYVTGEFNDHTRKLLKLGVKLHATGDHIIWARDQMGRSYDGLSDLEATPGTKEAMGLSKPAQSS